MTRGADRLRAQLGPADWQHLAAMSDLRLTLEYEVLGPARLKAAGLKQMLYESLAPLAIAVARDLDALARIETGGDRLEAACHRACALAWAAHREALARLCARAQPRRRTDRDPLL